MKVLIIFAGLICSVALVFNGPNVTRDAFAQEKKIPDVIVLAKEAKLGQVTFNHLKHISEKRSPDGNSQLACVDCHHTAQPAAEAAKHPPHKTAFPADRTSTLTAALLEKDAATVANVCVQ